MIQTLSKEIKENTTGRPDGCPPVTVLICSLNEENNLSYVLPRIPYWVDEILLVDGHSTDNTVEAAKIIRPEMKVVFQPGKGKGDALFYGIKQATGDIVVTLDADGATDPADMPNFIQPLLSGYDYAKGSRFRKNSPEDKPVHRIIGNWIITLVFDLLFFTKYTDICSGYNAFWMNKIVNLKLWSADGYENEPMINARLRKSGLKIIEVGHRERARISGEVKELSWRQGPKAIKSIIRERFSA